MFFWRAFINYIWCKNFTSEHIWKGDWNKKNRHKLFYLHDFVGKYNSIWNSIRANENMSKSMRRLALRVEWEQIAQKKNCSIDLSAIHLYKWFDLIGGVCKYLVYILHWFDPIFKPNWFFKQITVLSNCYWKNEIFGM